MPDLLEEAATNLKKNLDHLKSEYVRLQIGRASAALVENLTVEAYGTKQQLKALAHIAIPDAKTIQIQPWDKSQLQSVEKAILTSGLNLNPNNDGIVIRINIPPLTEERRRELTKVVNRLAEEVRVGVRHVRQVTMDVIKTQEKEKLISEDVAKSLEKKLQEDVDAANKEIEAMAKNKEHEVLTV